MRTTSIGGCLAAVALGVLLCGPDASARTRKAKEPIPQKPPEAADASTEAGTSDAAAIGGALVAQQPTGLKLIRDPVGWVKICPDKGSDKCEVSAGYQAAPAVPDTLVLAVATTPGPAHRVTALVPLNLNLRAGLVLTLGDTKGFVGTFGTCRSVGCTATVDISEEMYRALSKATTAYVVVQNGLGRTVSFEAPVDGFGAAASGPGRTPDEFVKAQREELERAQTSDAAKPAQNAAAPAPPVAASALDPSKSTSTTNAPAPPSAPTPDEARNGAKQAR